MSTLGLLADTLGKRNPFRYRGYVFDKETELYYLKSRYYSAGWGRFLNADVGFDTRYQRGLNLFNYGFNSALNFADASGNYAYSTIHNAVCEQIACDNPEIICSIYVVGISRTTSGTGFIDLINPFTSEAWEVKKSTLSYSCAEYQLSDYTSGTVHLGDREINDLRIGGFIPSGMAFYDDLIMPYYYVGNGVIMYETYRRQEDGSYIFAPSLSSIGEKNLMQNRARRALNYPDEPVPTLPGGFSLSLDWKTALSVVGVAIIVGGSAFLGYLAGGMPGAYAAGRVALSYTITK